MEWRCPRSVSGDESACGGLPVNGVDLLLFFARSERLGEELADEILMEVLAAVYQVEVLQRELRQVDRAIRLLRKSRKPVDGSLLLELREKRLGLQCRGVSLREALRRPRFGKYFPRTRHNLYRKMVRFAVKSEPGVKDSTQTSTGTTDFLQKPPRTAKLGSALCEPGDVSATLVRRTPATSVQLTQSQTTGDPFAAFWRDRTTELQEFISKGKI